MFHRVLAASLFIGAVGGASIALAQHALTPVEPAVTERSVHAAVEGAPCLETPFRVYFKADSADLDEGARSIFDAVGARVAGCGLLEIEIGADRAEVNASPRLMAQRAATVVMELENRGMAGDLSVIDGPSAAVVGPSPAFIEATVKPANLTMVSSGAVDARFE
jgi:hypothetical protein